MTGNEYLQQILHKYEARDLSPYNSTLSQLISILQNWASKCYLNILLSGSRAKGTAISLASDLDYFVSLSNNCNDNNGGLNKIYLSLFDTLQKYYPSARKQNVSVRIKLGDLEVDITPAKKQYGSENYHYLYVSKTDTRTQTNIKKHIDDVSQSGRTNEIKIIKIWRELNHLDFSSIYLEYLIISNILSGYSKSVDDLESNVLHIFNESAKTQGNPLFARIVDPANTTNILSNLMTESEKGIIIYQAQRAVQQRLWSQIVW